MKSSLFILGLAPMLMAFTEPPVCKVTSNTCGNVITTDKNKAEICSKCGIKEVDCVCQDQAHSEARKNQKISDGKIQKKK